MHRARLLSLLLLALAALATACGSSSRRAAPGSALQDSLRALASGAPPGDRAYWLGPQFHHAPVSFVSPGWGRFAMLSYRRTGDIVVDVASLAMSASVPAGGYQVRTRTPTGQDVVLIFRSPAHPSAALVRAARAALEPIPARVTYPA
jgi:hypothetical protein